MLAQDADAEGFKCNFTRFGADDMAHPVHVCVICRVAEKIYLLGFFLYFSLKFKDVSSLRSSNLGDYFILREKTSKSDCPIEMSSPEVWRSYVLPALQQKTKLTRLPGHFADSQDLCKNLQREPENTLPGVSPACSRKSGKCWADELSHCSGRE